MDLKTLKINHLIFLLGFIPMLACSPMKEKVDLILYNGTVYTVDNQFTVSQAFAISNGKFIAVGNNDEILGKYESDRMIDAGGEAVYPGFIDGHCHFYGYAENLFRYAELAGAASFEEVLQRLEAHVQQHPSEWILGRGWDHNLWEVQEFPDNELLEERFPGRKILLVRVDGHASLASKAALSAAGIHASTKVKGGEVLLNSRGLPSGILIDKADQAVKDLIPKLSDAEKKAALLEAQQKCFAVGLSSVTDAGLPYSTIELIRGLQNEGLLKMRISMMIDPDEATLDYYLPRGPEIGEKLSITAVKMYADGALGSRGAKLLEPYADDPANSGLILYEDTFYETIANRAYNAGFQVNMHAIGDSAVRKVLQIYAAILKGKNDRRWRLEHAQIVHPDDFKIFGDFSIIPSIQSTHATSDMKWAIDRVGEARLKGAYAQQQLLDQNGWLINGTDFPIEGISPIHTFFAAVFRKDADYYPTNGFQMENALSRQDAIRSMTIWAAKGAFEEKLKGSIEAGKLADFVILDRDLMTIAEEEILGTSVLQLFSGGLSVYRAE